MSITILKITIYVSMGLYGAWALFAIFAICGVNCVSEYFSLLFTWILTFLIRNELLWNGAFWSNILHQGKRCMLIPWMVFTGIVTGLCIWGIISNAKTLRKLKTFSTVPFHLILDAPQRNNEKQMVENTQLSAYEREFWLKHEAHMCFFLDKVCNEFELISLKATHFIKRAKIATTVQLQILTTSFEV